MKKSENLLLETIATLEKIITIRSYGTFDFNNFNNLIDKYLDHKNVFNKLNELVDLDALTNGTDIESIAKKILNYQHETLNLKWTPNVRQKIVVLKVGCTDILEYTFSNSSMQ